MSVDDFLLVRLGRSLTALERTLGLLRIQLLDLPRISLTSDGDGNLDVLVPLSACRIPHERLAAELKTLRDVRDVRLVQEQGDAGIREMALARVSTDGIPDPSGSIHLVTQSGDTAVVEISGSPREIDRTLEGLRSTGALLRTSRTGGVTVE